jgi:hypothetical protein
VRGKSKLCTLRVYLTQLRPRKIEPLLQLVPRLRGLFNAHMKIPFSSRMNPRLRNSP